MRTHLDSTGGLGHHRSLPLSFLRLPYTSAFIVDTIMKYFLPIYINALLLSAPETKWPNLFLARVGTTTVSSKFDIHALMFSIT